MRKAGTVLALVAAMLALGARKARALGTVVAPNAASAAQAGAAYGAVSALSSLLPSMDFAQGFNDFVQDFFRRDLSPVSDLMSIGYDDVKIMNELRALGKLENAARSLAELARDGFVAVIPDAARHLLLDRQASAPDSGPAPPPRSAPLKNPFSGDPADFLRPGGAGPQSVVQTNASPNGAPTAFSHLKDKVALDIPSDGVVGDPYFDQARRRRSSPVAIP